MTIDEMRKAAGMTQNAFAEYLGAHPRTVQGWCLKRHCPEYARKLIEYRLKMEGVIMEKIKVYKNTIYDGELSGGWRIFFTLHETEADTTEELAYILPAGYVVKTDTSGIQQIYTDRGEHCLLIEYEGKPALIDCAKPNTHVLLKKA